MCVWLAIMRWGVFEVTGAWRGVESLCAAAARGRNKYARRLKVTHSPAGDMKGGGLVARLARENKRKTSCSGL